MHVSFFRFFFLKVEFIFFQFVWTRTCFVCCLLCSTKTNHNSRIGNRFFFFYQLIPSVKTRAKRLGQRTAAPASTPRPVERRRGRPKRGNTTSNVPACCNVSAAGESSTTSSQRTASHTTSPNNAAHNSGVVKSNPKRTNNGKSAKSNNGHHVASTSAVLSGGIKAKAPSKRIRPRRRSKTPITKAQALSSGTQECRLVVVWLMVVARPIGFSAAGRWCAANHQHCATTTTERKRSTASVATWKVLQQHPLLQHHQHLFKTFLFLACSLFVCVVAARPIPFC